MTKLVWNALDTRRYESGVSHGVFYPSVGPGVAWNGLTAVREGSVGGDAKSAYLDGVKYIDYVEGRDYQATVTAFTSPLEFKSHAGTRPMATGITLFGQPRKSFNFSYRTEIEGGYKIHLVYNVLATNQAGGFSTIGSSGTAETRTWIFDAKPVAQAGIRPVAHFLVDSMRSPSAKLQALEAILYGSGATAPRFPTSTELFALYGGA